MSSPEPVLERRRRNLPHWTMEGSCYFVTFRLATGTLTEQERMIVLDHIKAGDKQFYLLAAAVIMPDHVHLLLRPQTGYSLSRVMKGIKGVSARLINQHRNRTGTIWQDESWDRIVRDQAEFEEKLNYMADNPVKAELVKHIDHYPAFYSGPD
ncbi:MAG: transposase [Planctomycetaceae bacterium]